MFYIYGAMALTIMVCTVVFCRKSSKPLRFIAILLSFFFLYMCARNSSGFLMGKLGLGRLVALALTAAVALVWLAIGAVCMKMDTKFGNYFILSLSFFSNLLKNRFSKLSSDEVGLGHIIPITSADVPKCGHYVSMPGRVLSSGTLIVGSSGSGKTYTIKELIKQDFKNGSPVVYFDFKGDANLRKELIAAANSNGYDIFCFNENYPYFFDPLANLTTEGRVESIMSTRKWDIAGADSHYRTNAKLLIQRYVSKFDQYLNAHLEDYGVMSVNELEYTKNLYYFVQKNVPDLSKREIADAYKTFKSLLEIILTSGMKETLMDGSLPHFNFEEFELSGNRRWVILVSLPSENKELGNSITNLYLTNLISVGAKVQNFQKNVKLYLEEFGTLQDSMVVKDLLEKGRSMGINTCISLQDVYQIVINTNEAYLNSLLGTITNYLIFAGTTKKAAELISGVQIKDIDKILLSLKRPNLKYNDRPTALLITKNALLERGKSSEIYKFFPGSAMHVSEIFGEALDMGGSEGPSKKDIRKAKDAAFVDLMNFKDF